MAAAMKEAGLGCSDSVGGHKCSSELVRAGRGQGHSRVGARPLGEAGGSGRRRKTSPARRCCRTPLGA